MLDVPLGAVDPTYRGRVAVLATKHGKEAQIAPALAPTGLLVEVTEIDTDRFGTFTGEVPRTGSPVEVAERKARAAMAATGRDAGLASEGSFGPHPGVPVLTADLEIVVLVDDLLGVVVAEQALSVDTAATSRTVAPGEDLSELCAAVGFPDQALICRPADGSPDGIATGLTRLPDLDRAVRDAARASADGLARVETDLRAHLCPTRRRVIAEAAERLAVRLMTRCPRCSVPGFGLTRSEQGRPCGLCGLPTRGPVAMVTTCSRCEHRERVPVPGPADPATCTWCNP
ncbi:hypothetical protein Q6348_00985 [Isoptericola sp. b441]|uniref:DUF6671 domain-containing protein n=1 Tax=Actinotalea lenta TaxID=3064654 RepID=A0ABT9D500_9CELL|nr:DUF6671 family protein [Isoptericola sp. b441]MDO8105768.1 hypothetical protein [Isoptericola sp. b441]